MKHLLLIATSVTFLAACQHHPVFPIIDYSERTGESVECQPDIVYFEKDVLPILLRSCAYAGCHDTKSREDGVILNNYENTMRTGGVKPYKPGESELYEVLFESGDDLMPPKREGRLSQADKDMIRDWIGQGAGNYFCKSCNSEHASFSVDISPTIDTYCLRCHNDSRQDGNVSLEGFSKIKATAVDGSLQGTITNTNGYPLMPEGGAMPDCEVAQIRKWIMEGALDN